MRESLFCFLSLMCRLMDSTIVPSSAVVNITKGSQKNRFFFGVSQRALRLFDMQMQIRLHRNYIHLYSAAHTIHSNKMPFLWFFSYGFVIIRADVIAII